MNLIYKIISLFIVIIALSGCQSKTETPASGKVIKVAVIGPLGWAAGDVALKGIKTAQLIEPNTNAGDKIVFSVFNDSPSPSATAKQYEKLAKQEDLKAIIILSTSDDMLAISHIADQYKLPVIGTIATHPEITKNSQFISRVSFSDDRQGKVAAIYVRDELLVDRAAILYDDNDEYSRNLKNIFRADFIAVGGEIVAALPILELKDNRAAILNELKEADVQLLYMVVSLNQTLEILETIEEINWSVKKMGADGILSQALYKAEEKLDLLDGFLATDHISTDLHLTEIGEQGRKTYLKHFGRPDAYTVLGFEAYLLLKNALGQCSPELERDCITQHIRNVKSFEGVFGSYAIKDGDSQRPVMVNEMMDGRMRLIVKVY